MRKMLFSFLSVSRCGVLLWMFDGETAGVCHGDFVFMLVCVRRMICMLVFVRSISYMLVCVRWMVWCWYMSADSMFAGILYSVQYVRMRVCTLLRVKGMVCMLVCARIMVCMLICVEGWYACFCVSGGWYGRMLVCVTGIVLYVCWWCVSGGWYV
jgi:hypothetical protein